ncbi:MAG: hypothetical protein JWN44_6859 [Myxococcales bacterium]|nr:hypothetical protein [Myxococcales bacterium]
MRRLVTGLLACLALGALTVAGGGCGDTKEAPQLIPHEQENVVPANLDPDRPRPPAPGQAETLRVPRQQ